MKTPKNQNKIYILRHHFKMYIESKRAFIQLISSGFSILFI